MKRQCLLRAVAKKLKSMLVAEFSLGIAFQKFDCFKHLLVEEDIMVVARGARALVGNANNLLYHQY